MKWGKVLKKLKKDPEAEPEEDLEELLEEANKDKLKRKCATASVYAVIGITGSYVTKGMERVQRLTAWRKEVDPGDVQEEDGNEKAQ